MCEPGRPFAERQQRSACSSASATYSPARALVTPREGNRGLSRPADPLRLRRFPERLRRHYRARAIPGRSFAHVLSDARCGQVRGFSDTGGTQRGATEMRESPPSTVVVKRTGRKRSMSHIAVVAWRRSAKSVIVRLYGSRAMRPRAVRSPVLRVG